MWTSSKIACIYILFLVLSCECGYKTKRPARCYYSRRQCETKCCCTGKRCEPTTGSGRPYHKCVNVDCGSLSDPANGNVVMLGRTTFESLAEYRCKDGYKLSYPAGKTCLSSGLWSGMAPRCEPEPDCALEECTKLEPPCNGLLVDAPMNPKPGDVVTYDCQEGFELEGEKNRTCQDDYTWDGNSPCCIKTCRQMSEYGISFEGSTYRLFRNPQRSWADAKSVCEADGAHLVEIKSAAENYHLETLIGSYNLWTNGNDIDNDGIWIWPIDGSNIFPVSSDVYSFWVEDEPSQSGACMYLDEMFEWIAANCTHTKEYVCEC